MAPSLTLILAVAAAAGAGDPVPQANAPHPSFDCSRAATDVERLICGEPRLALLDAELDQAFRAALRRGAQAREQRDWVRARRNACATAACLERVYLVRVEELEKSLGGARVLEKPPRDIFGSYSKSRPACSMDTDAEGNYRCEGEVEDTVSIKPGPGNALVVEFELWFHNGHSCSARGEAAWVASSLRLPLDTIDGGCVLVLKVKDGDVTFADPDHGCRSTCCGVRGALDGERVRLSAPRRTP